MLFPKDKMSLTSVYQGKTSDEGWLVLNIGNMDLEGVTKIYISMKDIWATKERTTQESDALERAKRLLGGE